MNEIIKKALKNTSDFINIIYYFQTRSITSSEKHGDKMRNNIIFIFFVTLFVMCNKSTQNDPVQPIINEEGWKTGTVKTYTIKYGTEVKVDDIISGLTFLFPQGGNGDLKITQVISGPNLDEGNSAFKVEYTGNEKVQIMLPHSNNDIDFLRAAVPASGLSISNPPKKNILWVRMPEKSSSAGSIIFDLPLSANSLYKNSWSGINTFYPVRIQSGTPEHQAFTYLGARIDTAVQLILKAIPESRKIAAQNAIKGRLKYQYDLGKLDSEGYYDGVWYILGLTSPHCHIRVAQDASKNSIAHEVGHYIHHVLIGDDRWAQFQINSPNPHNVGIPKIDRTFLSEDFAYFAEYYINGLLSGNMSPEEPAMLMSYSGPSGATLSNSPDLVDFPTIEGFPVTLFASLFRTGSNMVDFKKYKVGVPVVNGITWQDIYEIIAKCDYTTSIDYLRSEIENLLAINNMQHDRLPAMMEPLGWSYKIKVRILDNDKNPVKGASIRPICRTDLGKKEYARFESLQSGTDGLVRVERVFPGTSILRVYFTNKENKRDSLDVENIIDWKSPTNTEITKSDITVNITELPPKITSISPNIFNSGDEISIYGQNFGNDKTKGEVFFNTTKAVEVIQWISNLIKVKVPAISEDGNIYVAVNGNKSNTSAFTLVRPILEKVKWYNYGYDGYAGLGFGFDTIYSAGDQLELTGRNFGNTRGQDSKIFVGGIEVTSINFWNDGIIRFIVPDGAKSGLIEITKGKIKSNGIQCTIKNIWDDYINKTNWLSWTMPTGVMCKVKSGSGSTSEIGVVLQSNSWDILNAVNGKVIQVQYVKTISVNEKYTFKVDGNLSDNGRIITNLKIEEIYEKFGGKEIEMKYGAFQNIPIYAKGVSPVAISYSNYFTRKNVTTDFKYSYTNSADPSKNLTIESFNAKDAMITINFGKK